MEQPVAKATHTDIIRIIERDYPIDKKDEILEALGQYKGDSKKGEYRIWASLLKISRGHIEELKENIERAKIDYRDILAVAEYPEYSEKVGFDSKKITKQELKSIIKADWQQYQDWLRANKKKA